MEIPSPLSLVVVDSTLDTNIQAAVKKANTAPGAAVWVPKAYPGTDSVPGSPGCVVFDMRANSNIVASTFTGNTVGTSTGPVVGNVTGNVTGNLTGLTKIASAGAAAPITSTTGGTFVTTLNLPGNSVFEQLPFKVKAAGWVSLNGGTYTATVQPLLYASTSLGFTASAAAAIMSATAQSVPITIASAATITTFPWEIEVNLSGDSTSGLLTGRTSGSMRAGAPGTVSVSYPVTAANGTWNQIVNVPPSINFASATPLQFLVGVTVGGATVSSSVQNLGNFYLES